LIIGTVIIVGSITLVLRDPASIKYQNLVNLNIGSTSLQVEVVESKQSISKGLSGRKSLEEGTGMLFSFSESGIYGFWMREMYFPIDIIWIGESFEVLGTENWVSPETFPEIFYSPEKTKYVLEVNAGFAEKNGIDTRDMVYLNTNI